MIGTGEEIENWEVDDMMADGDKNNDYQIDFEGNYNLRAVGLLFDDVIKFCNSCRMGRDDEACSVRGHVTTLQSSYGKAKPEVLPRYRHESRGIPRAIMRDNLITTKHISAKFWISLFHNCFVIIRR